MLLIDKLNAEQLKAYPNERSLCACHGDLSVNDLLPEFVTGEGHQQFIVGLYCEGCGLGFLPDFMVKPAPQSWQLTELGWHPVNSDGSLGPPQLTISG